MGATRLWLLATTGALLITAPSAFANTLNDLKNRTETIRAKEKQLTQILKKQKVK